MSQTQQKLILLYSPHHETERMKLISTQEGEPVIKIYLSSTNTHKVQATEKVFGECFPMVKLEIEKVKVASEVREQPQGKNEILQGAYNRCRNMKQPGEICLSMENGIYQRDDKWYDVAVIMMTYNDQRWVSWSPSVEIPDQLINLFEKEVKNNKDITIGKIAQKVYSLKDESSWFEYVTKKDRTFFLSEGLRDLLDKSLCLWEV